MAKLLAYYNLCPTNVGTEFLGLSPDFENGAVINTLGRNMVIIVKLSNQKQLRSWTVLDRLTAKVVYDFKSRNYVGVFMNQYLRQWDENCVDVNKIKKQKFNRNIHDVFSMEHLNTTIILYENGNTEALDLGMLNRKTKEEDDVAIVDRGSSIKKVNFFDMSNGTMVTYFVENLTDKSIELVYFMLERDTCRPQGNINRIKIARAEPGVDLCGYIVLRGALYPSLISIWSDKRIFMQHLQLLDTFDRLSHSSTIGQFIAMLANLNLKQPLSIIGIGEDYFAVYGANNGQEGALLMLYNLKFRIVQAQQFFKVYFTNSNLWIIGNNLFLALGQMLSVVPFRISKEQLSDIIGTQRNKEFSNHVDKEYINEEYELEESLVFDANLQSQFENLNMEITTNGNETHKKENTISKLDYFTSFEKVENQMNSILNFEVLFDILREQSNPKDTVIAKLYTNPNGTLVMSDNFEILSNELEKMGFNEIEITEKLIPVLIADEAVNDLVICLKKYTNISEKELVAAMMYAIKRLIASNTPVDFTVEDQTPFKLLNTTLSCTYNTESILPYLRNDFNLELTLFLLKYLKEFLLAEDIELEENPQTALNHNTENVLINWMSILIDSQYQELLLTKNDSISELIFDILSVVRRFISMTKEMKDIIPILENCIDKKSTSPSKQYSKWYSIENVKLY